MLSRDRWAAAARDALPALAALGLSPLVAATAPTVEKPLERMRRLIDAERSMGLFFEPAVHGWCASRPTVMRALNVTYVAAHLPGVLGVLAWAWYAHPDDFPLARDAFVATQALAVIGYVLVPTAPPRMVPGLGYDRGAGVGDTGLGRVVQSPYAAMPSAHTAFSLVAAGTVWALARSPAVRAAAVLYPPAVVGEIIATGDHVWLDALGGAVVAGLGLAGAFGLRRRRRRRRSS
jgi:hypothetical protein